MTKMIHYIQSYIANLKKKYMLGKKKTNQKGNIRNLSFIQRRGRKNSQFCFERLHLNLQTEFTPDEYVTYHLC